MKEAARAEGLCSFDNSNEWLVRTEETLAFWNRFVQQYAKKTYAEWHEEHGTELESDLEEATDQWRRWYSTAENKNKKIAGLEKENSHLKEQVSSNTASQELCSENMNLKSEKNHWYGKWLALTNQKKIDSQRQEAREKTYKFQIEQLELKYLKATNKYLDLNDDVTRWKKTAFIITAVPVCALPLYLVISSAF